MTAPKTPSELAEEYVVKFRQGAQNEFVYRHVAARMGFLAGHAEALKLSDELVDALEIAICIAESGHVDETFARYAERLLAAYKAARGG